MYISTLTLTILSSLLTWRIITLSPLHNAAADQPTEVEILFTELVKANFIQVQTDASITLPPQDQALSAAWNGKPLSKSTQRYLTDLYNSAAGQALRHDIELWNRSRRLTAVRDNAVNSGATHSVWNAYHCDSDILINTNALVAESFGYVHQGRLRSGFSSWNAITPPATWSESDSDCVEWRGQFRAAKALPVEVWYIGKLVTSTTERGHSGQAVALLPPRSQQLPTCAAAAIPPSQAGSWRISDTAWIRHTGNNWFLNVKLRLTPARDPSFAAQGLRVSVSPQDCTPQWNQVTAKSDVIGTNIANWQVDTVDEVTLLTDNVTPTAHAQTLGLLPLVGYGADDAHGLGAWLNSASGGGQLTLTLNSRIQALAKATLAKHLKKLATPDWANERRAALILMDTDGAILAAVGFPDAPSLNQVTAWDLAAFARIYPDSNPLQVRAWEGVDRHQAAGSTFKTVTALAGLSAATAMPNVANVLAGLNSKSFSVVTGTRLKDFQIDPLRISGGHGYRTIRNFQSEPLSYLLNKEGRAKSCPGQGTDKYDLSLTSAVRDSMNTWFVALSMLVDGAAADHYRGNAQPLCQQNPLPDLYLAKTMCELGIGSKQPLLANPPPVLQRTVPKSAADQIDLLNNAPGNLRWVIAQASIGQGALVTPLRMATIAASIAAGEQVTPHLDAAWNKIPSLVNKVASGIWQSDLTLLRRGMQAVIQNGTAHTAFLKTPPSIRCHTYAKTGTAQVARRDSSGQLENFGSAWIIGWHQPPQIQAPLAFACFITHTQNTGGEICAPIIAEILQNL